MGGRVVVGWLMWDGLGLNECIVMKAIDRNVTACCTDIVIKNDAACCD